MRCAVPGGDSCRWWRNRHLSIGSPMITGIVQEMAAWSPGEKWIAGLILGATIATFVWSLCVDGIQSDDGRI